jgi:hypothetical protein
MDTKNCSNVRILVRIRSPGMDTTPQREPLNRNDEKQTANRYKSPLNRSKDANKSRSGSKSPSSNSLKSNTALTIENTTPLIANGLKENAKYSIFTSLSPSNTIVVTNNPINGKLINNTFLTTNDLFDYSYSLIKDATLLEFDRVYNESIK